MRLLELCNEKVTKITILIIYRLLVCIVLKSIKSVNHANYHMEVKHLKYQPSTSRSRIANILRSPDNINIQNNKIPPRDRLTYQNGFYVPVTVIFIDIN